MKTADALVRGSLDDSSAPLFLGRVTETAAADMYLSETEHAVVLQFTGPGGRTIRLTKEAGTRYELRVTNQRVIHAADIGRGDFEFYYEAFSDPSGKKYYLKPAETSSLSGDRYSFRKVDYAVSSLWPGICEVVYLSKTRTLSR